ncbi:MAG TPA: hypothetical protein DDY68_05160 [Porphyromonadaceae bacterium]|nr:hypothetical protein [Porphyromonadaceae bacterium]
MGILEKSLLLKVVFLIGLAFCNPSMMIWSRNPNQEFRGVWMQTIYQGQYKTMDKEEMEDYFVHILDKMSGLGINAIIFQVRPEADAFYNSKYEPWSRHLTGVQGMPPEEEWDPMEFLIAECHKRNMEFHAWINPFRVQADSAIPLSSNHIYYKHPEWFVKYGKGVYFDPGMPQSRNFCAKVVEDIVTRYDVDAIHIDDYFYPYPVKGEEFPDEHSFKLYGEKQGLNENQKDDWRRENINRLIQKLFITIKKKKPWVRFGVSPFGIYRNESKEKRNGGSETSGLQCYDDLYADVLRWDKEMYIDYVVPQLYWRIGHKVADYEVLLYWWNKNIKNAHLYIGQSVVSTPQTGENAMKGFQEMVQKLELADGEKHVKGNCYWSYIDLVDNSNHICPLLTERHQGKALVSSYEHLCEEIPDRVQGLETKIRSGKRYLVWEKNVPNPDKEGSVGRVVKYAVYRFPSGKRVNVKSEGALIAITKKNYYALPTEKAGSKYTYVVVAGNRVNRVSKKLAKTKVVF